MSPEYASLPEKHPCLLAVRLSVPVRVREAARVQCVGHGGCAADDCAAMRLLSADRNPVRRRGLDVSM